MAMQIHCRKTKKGTQYRIWSTIRDVYTTGTLTEEQMCNVLLLDAVRRAVMDHLIEPKNTMRCVTTMPGWKRENAANRRAKAGDAEEYLPDWLRDARAKDLKAGKLADAGVNAILAKLEELRTAEATDKT